MFPQIPEKREGTAEEKQHYRKYPRFSTACKPAGKTVEHHEESQQSENAQEIIGHVDPQPQIFKISHQKLEHKVILYIFSAKMGYWWENYFLWKTTASWPYAARNPRKP